MIRVLAIRVIDRIKESGHTQGVLSRHSDIITARLGFHELNDDTCSREGYIVLLVKDDDTGYIRLTSDLDMIWGIEVREVTSSKNQAAEIIIPDAPGVVTIATLMVENRGEASAEIQDILSRYGCSIRTRLGLNNVIEGQETGIIILELTGEVGEQRGLVQRLTSVANVSISVVSFN